MSDITEDFFLDGPPLVLGTRFVRMTAMKPRPDITKYTLSGPVRAYNPPAKAGAARVIELIAAELNAIALVNLSRETSCGIMACLAGIIKENAAPCTTAAISKWYQFT